MILAPAVSMLNGTVHKIYLICALVGLSWVRGDLNGVMAPATRTSTYWVLTALLVWIAIILLARSARDIILGIALLTKTARRAASFAYAASRSTGPARERR